MVKKYRVFSCSALRPVPCLFPVPSVPGEPRPPPSPIPGPPNLYKPCAALAHGKRKHAKNIHTYNAYNVIMPAVKRIPVTEPVWKDLAEMRAAGQTYTDLLTEMIEDRKKRRLEEDVKKWSGRKKKGYVSLSEIKD